MTPMVRRPLGVEQALLGLLSERPMHGYEIHQCLSHPTGLGLVWHIKQGQTYALLTRLEGDGLLVATVEPQDTLPSRRVYRLTESGLAAFRAWLQSPVGHPREVRLEFLAKLYFARLAGAATLRHLLQVQEAECRSWLAVAEAATVGPADEYDRWVSAYRASQIRAFSEWLQECIQAVTAAM